MKNLVTSILFVLAFAAAHAAQAQTIRRVNNTGITGTLIYATIDAAITASAAGDIIQVEPSGTSYGSVDLNKVVTIVGPGYFLDPSQNAGLQANPLEAEIGTFTLRPGGAGSYVAGLTISNFYNVANNVTIQRCRITQLYANATSGLGITANLTGVNIIQNYIQGISNFAGPATDNILISNNIIGSLSLPTNANGGIFNNVVTSSINVSNFFISSNYFASTGTGVTGNGNTLNNNISATASFPTTNGNQANVPQSAVFVLAPGGTAFDAWYQLKAGTNPARGTGQGGVDVGAFGGTAPYKLGGLPNIPAIYQQTETIVGNSLNATLSTRSNN